MVQFTHLDAVLVYGVACSALGAALMALRTGRVEQRAYEEGRDDERAQVSRAGLRDDAAEGGPGLPAALVPGSEAEEACGDAGLGQRRRGGDAGVPGSEGSGDPLDDPAGYGPDDYVTGGWDGPEPGDRLWDQVHGTSTYADSLTWRSDQEGRFAALVAELHESWAAL